MEDLSDKTSGQDYFRILVPQIPSVECSSPEHSATYAPKSSQTNALEPSTNHRDAQACANIRHGDSAQLHAQHHMPLTPEKPSGAEGRGKLPARKAFIVTCFGIRCVVSETRGNQAKYVAIQAAYEAGYGMASYTSVRVVRAPKYDQWAQRQDRRGCFIEEFVAKEVAREGGTHV